MKAFHTIAIPHKDILEGKLTMDVFAADLWEVTQKRGPDEYKDAETFFRKTYLTEGLKNLLGVVEKRLRGQGGDPVIQIQTPFGGGKTHALIAMYHKADEWSAKKVAIVGTAMGTAETIWGALEKSLSGHVAKLSGQVAPGKEAIRELLHKNQPVLILMDEVLEYVTKAAGVKVGESTLAAQTIAFVQELTEAVSTLDKTCLAVTLPASIPERYDEAAERLYLQLQKVSGRIEKIYTPVQENEITRIIRRRLFADIDMDATKRAVAEFMKYAEKEELLPVGVQPSEYRDRFVDSYPFMPEVVDILYHRWGSFPTFQRTRGVLRLLSLVIYSLRISTRPYISLADFDLANQEIRQELLKHIGAEYNSVLAADIVDVSAGAAKVDLSLGKAHQGLRLGTRAAIGIFLHSFSGGHEHGATLGEIKRCATNIGNPASVVSEAVEQLKSRLYFLQNMGDKYFFTNQPNLNRILLTNMENIREDKVVDTEGELLRVAIALAKLKVFAWEENPGNIPDSEDLKLIILKKRNEDAINNILRNKGQTPRTYRNTLFFLCPMESDRPVFINTIKKKIAWEYIERDKNLNLSKEQKEDVKKEIKRAEVDMKDAVRRFYRLVSIPVKDGLKEIDLGIPTFGEDKSLAQEVYEKLRSGGDILEKIAPLILKEKYLVSNDYAATELIYQASLKTPGEPRPIDRSVLENSINEGVRVGLFGLGELQNDKPFCRFYKEQPSISFAANEVIISEVTCREQKSKETPVVCEPPKQGLDTSALINGQSTSISPGPVTTGAETRSLVAMRFQVPKGKVSSIMGTLNLLQSKFSTLELRISASGGSISEQDYEDKVKEAFRQLGIEVEER